MNKLKLIFLLLILWGTAGSFQVVDEGSVIKIKTGQQVIKYITLYNLEQSAENVTIDWYLQDWPDKELPAYRVDLLFISTEQKKLTFRPNSSLLYPVKLKASKKLVSGRYVYWLTFTKNIAETATETSKYVQQAVQRLPLIIEIY
jgi:hypothetical protein